MMLLTLRGTPTLYYGDEIGMRDVPIPQNEIQDPQGLNMPDKNLSRDPARTPMPWTEQANAGFTTAARPWLRLDRNASIVNVARQRNDPFSMLALYERLINLRQQQPALQIGNYTPVYADHQIFSYMRTWADAPSYIIVLNLTHRTASFRPPQAFKGVIELSTSPEIEGQRVQDRIEMGGDEGIIIRLDEGQTIANTNQ